MGVGTKSAFLDFFKTGNWCLSNGRALLHALGTILGGRARAGVVAGLRAITHSGCELTARFILGKREEEGCV